MAGAITSLEAASSIQPSSSTLLTYLTVSIFVISALATVVSLRYWPADALDKLDKELTSIQRRIDLDICSPLDLRSNLEFQMTLSQLRLESSICQSYHLFMLSSSWRWKHPRGLIHLALRVNDCHVKVRRLQVRVMMYIESRKQQELEQNLQQWEALSIQLPPSYSIDVIKSDP
ncbi:hypothetical protein C8J56DRAFT_1038050 [Mycena floridula]|nr:hypothetical protein C8J56DRAFT_1038050 [Mycena floridula]